MIHTDKKLKNQIYTDEKQIQADPRKSCSGLLYAELTYKIRGAVFAVYNNLGFGHKEQVYQKALAKEFMNIKIPYLKTTGFELGLLVNFGHPRLVIKRLIWTGGGNQ